MYDPSKWGDFDDDGLYSLRTEIRSKMNILMFMCVDVECRDSHTVVFALPYIT